MLRPAVLGAVFAPGKGNVQRLVRFNIRLGSPYVQKVTGRDFWELRTKVGSDIYRTFYFAHTGKKFVLLHAFQKKSQKAPRKELETAEERMRDRRGLEGTDSGGERRGITVVRRVPGWLLGQVAGS